MPKCTAEQMSFGRLGRRVIEADFSGGSISSDGGLMLLQQVDRKLGLSHAAARVLHDDRDPTRVTHDMRALVAQRLYGLCCGYEDLNDHDSLRRDPLAQTAVGVVRELASSPTFSRLETGATRADCVALNRVLVEQFIASFEDAPTELVLDVDASDVPLHGDQELKQFHGYYDRYCYLPLYVFCGQSLLACLLRPSRIDGAKHCAALIKLLVTRLREVWPAVRIIVRGDSGFCRQLLIRWCERHAVHYLIGVARNARLHKAVEGWERLMQARFEHAQEKQRLIREITYQADSWACPRRVITRLEFGGQGNNPRFVVTNLEGEPQALYDGMYCQRGEAENRIKEAQLDLFGRRASCHAWQANQLRLLLAALAYTLMVHLRRLALQGTQLARACTQTIRTRLLKIGAAIIRNTRRVQVLLASNHPMKAVFLLAAQRLGP